VGRGPAGDSEGGLPAALAPSPALGARAPRLWSRCVALAAGASSVPQVHVPLEPIEPSASAPARPRRPRRESSRRRAGGAERRGERGVQ
jgi:hypothetical protein